MLHYNDNMGPDGKRLSVTKRPWNPDMDYGDDRYIRAYFRLTLDGHVFNGRWWEFTSEAKKDSFFAKAREVLKAHGIPEGIGGEREGFPVTHLHVHPMHISGIVKMNEVKSIAEDLDACEGITVEWVDLYEEVYDMDNNEVLKKLQMSRDEIEHSLLELCVTKRSNLFVTSTITGETPVTIVRDRYHIPRRWAERTQFDSTTEQYVTSVLEDLVKEGFLRQANDCKDGTGYQTVMPRSDKRAALQRLRKKLTSMGLVVHDMNVMDKLIGYRVDSNDYAKVVLEDMGIRWEDSPGRETLAISAEHIMRGVSATA